jgi:nitroreductase
LVEDLIKTRRSVRKFKDKPVSVNQIRRIIEAGTYAPSGKNGQPWRFTVLTGQEKDTITNLMDEALQSLAKKHGNAVMGSSLKSCGVMKNAPVLVFVWNKGGFTAPRLHDMMSKVSEIFPDSEKLLHMADIQGVAAAIQNMLLMAHDMGLGSLWINDVYYVLDELTEYFDNSWELVAAVSFGYPDESEMNKSPPPKLTVDEVTEFR